MSRGHAAGRGQGHDGHTEQARGAAVAARNLLQDKVTRIVDVADAARTIDAAVAACDEAQRHIAACRRTYSDSGAARSTPAGRRLNSTSSVGAAVPCDNECGCSMVGTLTCSGESSLTAVTYIDIVSGGAAAAGVPSFAGCIRSAIHAGRSARVKTRTRRRLDVQDLTQEEEL